MTNIATLVPDVRLDLRYASSTNITGKVLTENATAYLQTEAAEAFSRAAEKLRFVGLTFVVWDAYRTPSVHMVLLGLVHDERYVKTKSNHCVGLAIDVTLCDAEGNYLDMGTDFDDFTPTAHSNASTITREQAQNRTTLATAMEMEGYRQWPYEWWHFDFQN